MRIWSNRLVTRTRAAVALAAVGAVTVGSGLVLSGTAVAGAGNQDHDQDAEHKVLVCKYVSSDNAPTGLRLKDGENPIEVAAQTIDTYPNVQVGDRFADAQGPSVVVAPGTTACPDPETPPSPLATTTTETRTECTAGVESRTRTVTTPYVWSNETLDWVLGTPGAPVYSSWVKVRDLTPAEYRELGCAEQPPRPDDKVTTATETQKSCAAGVETRTVTVTTPYVWDAEASTWVLGTPGQPVYGHWAKVRDLTPAEIDELGCEQPPVEPIVVSPLAPTVNPATCDADGSVTLPTQPQGVLVQQTGNGPGEVTFTFTAATGYAFPVGTGTEVVVVVPAQLTGPQCAEVLPTEGVKPKPTREPTVKGVQAFAPAVPRQVDAGLSGEADGTPVDGTTLVGAGLLLMAAGAATGLGRRARGSHEGS